AGGLCCVHRGAGIAGREAGLEIRQRHRHEPPLSCRRRLASGRDEDRRRRRGGNRAAPTPATASKQAQQRKETVMSERPAEKGTRSQQHEIVIDAPPEAVWKAISDAEELTRWFVDEASIEPRVGGMFTFSWG